ncbi:MAG: GNAT family N-acetyltransferase [Oscillospiraceae bacterium]|nr:GNAT family N-acetyltransferase [Oscillospiraceae bacterium]
MIVTERLIINKFEKSDWKDIYEYLSDNDVVKFEPYEPLTKDKALHEAEERAKNPAFWAVRLKDTNKLIGNIYLSEADFKTWELGYVFNKKYWGNHYAAESAYAVINYIFKTKDAWRIVAMCDPLNIASWKLLERLGMRREGHLIKNVYFKFDSQGNPIWKDTYEYAILREEWVRNQE